MTDIIILSDIMEYNVTHSNKTQSEYAPCFKKRTI